MHDTLETLLDALTIDEVRPPCSRPALVFSTIGACPNTLGVVWTQCRLDPAGDSVSYAVRSLHDITAPALSSGKSCGGERSKSGGSAEDFSTGALSGVWKAHAMTITCSYTSTPLQAPIHHQQLGYAETRVRLDSQSPPRYRGVEGSAKFRRTF